VSGLAEMFSHPFMRHAFLGGTATALAAGLVGYFVVLRSQVFTGDALSHVAFAGALGALAIGVDARAGLFVSTIVVGVVMGALGHRGRPDDVVTGSVFAWILGLGVLFLTIFTTRRSAGNGIAGVNVLFGSILGLSGPDAQLAAVVALVVVGILIVISRPLLFASLDEAVAGARRVPVRALGTIFLAAVGATAAEATQAVGALLLLGLLAGPAAAAQRLTARPYRALALSGALAVAAMWGGLTVSYLAPRVPPSFAVIAIVTVVYIGTIGLSRWESARAFSSLRRKTARGVQAAGYERG
jgi:zinc/manganese transport system permease protein